MNVEELLSAYAAGELSGAERERVEAALAVSPHLRAELARYEQLFALLAAAGAEEIEPPIGLQSRVARWITLREYAGAAGKQTAETLGAFAALIAPVLIAPIIWRRFRERRRR